MLESTVADITARLRQGKISKRAGDLPRPCTSCPSGAGWDTWDTNVVWPEYQTGEGRADFALCHTPSKPSVFIEVKRAVIKLAAEVLA
jgi:hypothetical protein